MAVLKWCRVLDAPSPAATADGGTVNSSRSRLPPGCVGIGLKWSNQAGKVLGRMVKMLILRLVRSNVKRGSHHELSVSNCTW